MIITTCIFYNLVTTYNYVGIMTALYTFLDNWLFMFM